MKKLLTLTHADIGYPAVKVERYDTRHAARLVIFNAEGNMALLRVEKHGYFKLPGGGMEPGETWQQAAKREALEEVGCAVTLRDAEVGSIVEYRDDWALEHISYCAVADQSGAQGELNRDDYEVEDGQAPEWVTIDEAIKRLKTAQTEQYMGKFIIKRDLAFLEEAKRLLNL